LIVGEIGKQIYTFRMFPEGYNYWYFPLHFCSTYFIWFSLAEFTFGKLRRTMQSIAVVSCLYAVIGMYVGPRGVLGVACDDVFFDYYTAYSVLFHHLVVLYLMLSIAFRRFHPKMTDALVWIVCFSIYFATAYHFAYKFGINFFNILESSSIPPMETVRLQFGQFWYTAILASVVVLLGAIVVFICACVRKGLENEVDEVEWELVEVTEE
jgi:hypothetical protein